MSRRAGLQSRGSQFLQRLPAIDDATIASMEGKRRATVEDLYRVPNHSKAEIVHGELVVMVPSGDLHGYAALEIAVSLRDYGRCIGKGRAVPDNVGFVVNLPHRLSFSPDAAYHVGPSFGGEFIEGAPVFAVEVRSKEDNGLSAERSMAAKRADYFAAGTLVVWDVDVLKEGSVRVYRASDPSLPTEYRRGDIAEAEPAVPGWRFPVNDLFLPAACPWV